MKKILSGSSNAPAWLLTLAALVIGLTLGRYLIPAAPISGEQLSSSQNPRHRDREADSPGLAARGKPASQASAGPREINRRPARDLESQLQDLSEILNRGSRIERTREMLALIDRLGNEDLQELIDGFRESGWVDHNRGEYSMLISAWMHRAPFEALSHLEEHDPDGWTRRLAVAAWASEDPAAAVIAVESLEDEGEVNDWMVGLAEGMARNDPEEALDLLAGLASDKTRESALREIVPEVGLRGLEFSAEWLEQIRDPDLKREAAHRLAGSLAHQDPAGASEWVTSLDDPEMRRDGSRVVSEIYAREDLDGAKDWVASLPEESVGVAAQNVARHLTRKDPVEAADWLRNLGETPALDQARIRFLQEAGRRDPVTALESVPTLSRPKDQERYYRDILNRWRKQDRDAAVAWATDHSDFLPPKVLRSILPKNK